MPRLCEFYGVRIYMYYLDHRPPHFRAVYAQHEAEIEIETAGLLVGYLPPRAMRLVQEWARRYRWELRLNWRRCEHHQPVRPIPPLD